MRPEDWQITLEAYLDGELDAEQVRAFEELVAADDTVRVELDMRTSLRRTWRRALRAVDPTAEINPAAGSRTRSPLRRTTWIPLAVAASLVLALVLPRMLMNRNPGYTIIPALTRSGQVAALHYGEIPGQTMILEPEVVDLPLGRDH